jgi:hypothetical protein
MNTTKSNKVWIEVRRPVALGYHQRVPKGLSKKK